MNHKYISTTNPTVDSRLSQASYNLRLLTEKSIEDTESISNTAHILICAWA